MKLLLAFLFTAFVTSLHAQDGIQFSHGTWKETLAKAKAENKLIFIDVYTSWCGPCKLMAKDIFPRKAVGDKFNAGFINYKIDAEKGEGIDIAKTYSANAYPTYLFVNGEGTLYYRSLGSMPEEKFLQEADNALMEFKDPKPLPVWEGEYPSRKKDKGFLYTYLQKRQKLRLESDEVLDQYVSLASREELLTKDVIAFLLKSETARVDGAFYKFITENRAEVEKQTGMPADYLTYKLTRYIATDLKRAVDKRDVQLLGKLLAAREAIPSEIPADWETDALRMSFYTQTKNQPELIKVLDHYSKSILAYDRNKIKEADARGLKQFEEALVNGRMKESTSAEIESSRKFYGSKESVSYAYRVRGLAESALKAVNDKKVLNEALDWMHLAAEYSDNFTIAEVTAGILLKLGKKEEAIEYQQKAIAAFENLKLDNQIIKGRLASNLVKIKEGKPTWIETKAPSIATKG